MEGVSSHGEPQTLRILYFNARSILPKLDELRTLCAMDSPDVVCIVETWLDGEICDQELVIDGYCVVRRDRNRHGGGVLMYIRASLEYNVLPVPDNQLEFLPISVKKSLFSL